MRYLSSCLLALALFLGGCRKNDRSSDTGTSPLLFVNTSLHDPSVDIYSNGSLLYSQLSFPDSTGYLNTAAPVNRLALVSTGDTLLNVPTAFTAGRLYSVFVLDSEYGGGVGLAVIADILPAAHPGYTSLRFLNFSPSVSNLDLYSTSAGQDLFTDRYFDETDAFATSFVSFPAGVYDLELRAPGTFVDIATLSGLDLQAGKAYTLFAKGATNVMGSRTLGIGVLQHN